LAAFRRALNWFFILDFAALLPLIVQLVDVSFFTFFTDVYSFEIDWSFWRDLGELFVLSDSSQAILLSMRHNTLNMREYVKNIKLIGRMYKIKKLSESNILWLTGPHVNKQLKLSYWNIFKLKFKKKKRMNNAAY